MALEQLDPRITRTRQLLQCALLDLARAKPLEAITIADIAEQAKVNRSTFYQHYSDKETLLADALDAQAIDAGADLSLLDPTAEPGAEGHPLELVQRYTRHVAEHASLYRRALGEHGSPIAVARLRRRIASVARRGFAIYGHDDEALGLPVELAAASVAGSLLGMIGAWLESADPAPPDQLAAWIWKTLAPDSH